MALVWIAIISLLAGAALDMVCFASNVHRRFAAVALLSKTVPFIVYFWIMRVSENHGFELWIWLPLTVGVVMLMDVVLAKLAVTFWREGR